MTTNATGAASLDTRRRLATACIALGIALAMGGCDGGTNGTGTSVISGPPGSIAMSTRVDAATATAESDENACTDIQPFYWEVGDSTTRRASGSVSLEGSDESYTSTTLMPIASASKWIYGAYVVQLRDGALSDSDITFLTFRSGYSRFSRCLPTQTVDECVAYEDNDVHSDITDGLFSYGGGHMEKHASLIGLGPDGNADLADEIRSQLGSDLTPLTYVQPQLAGGVVTTADVYAKFLRKILSGSLLMNDALGTDAVCTNPFTCADAFNSPVPDNEEFHYSIGHWVEDDPIDGDGAFSSAGAFGFYPWIDASKKWYGIVARRDTTGTDDTTDPDAAGHGYASLQCGRLIRAAWMDGVAR